MCMSANSLASHGSMKGSSLLEFTTYRFFTIQILSETCNFVYKRKKTLKNRHDLTAGALIRYQILRVDNKMPILR